MRHPKALTFLTDMLKGAAIGVAFIIPGFSGGSVAAILGIYEKLVDAVADLFHHFFKSIRVLLPVAVGMILGFCALIFPIRWGMDTYPLPTVSLFVGLALGGLGPLRKQTGKRTPRHILIFFLALVVAASFVFLPAASHEAGFLFRLDAVGYLLLFLVGIAASCAFVVPGISGSMILLIFGYYAPILDLLTGFLLGEGETARSLAVIAVFGCGMAVGFFLVATLMRTALRRYPHATYCAILGFILGSVVSVYAPVLQTVGPPCDLVYWLIAILLLFAGAASSYAFTRLLHPKENMSETLDSGPKKE